MKRRSFGTATRTGTVLEIRLTLLCYYPGNGWVLNSDDVNDACANDDNDANQCADCGCSAPPIGSSFWNSSQTSGSSSSGATVSSTSGASYNPCWCETPPENACTDADKAAGAAATKLYIETVKAQAANFAKFKDEYSNQNEQTFLVTLSGGTYTPGDIVDLGPIGGHIIHPNNTYADVHTHPWQVEPYPSAHDILNAAYHASTIEAFNTSYIVAADGTKYALQITDRVKAKTFYDTNKDNADQVTSFFTEQSTIGREYADALNGLIANFSTEKSAREHALGYILKDSGIMVLKASRKSDDFKKIGADKELDASGQPVLDGTGKPKFVKLDCK